MLPSLCLDCTVPRMPAGTRWAIAQTKKPSGSGWVWSVPGAGSGGHVVAALWVTSSVHCKSDVFSMLSPSPAIRTLVSCLMRPAVAHTRKCAFECASVGTIPGSAIANASSSQTDSKQTVRRSWFRVAAPSVCSVRLVVSPPGRHRKQHAQTLSCRRPCHPAPISTPS